MTTRVAAALSEPMRRRTAPRVYTPLYVVASLLFVFVLSPFTIVFAALQGVNYYLTSALLIVYALVLFRLSFTARRPAMRDIVALGIMVIVCTLGRLVFIWLPHFKPTAALVIVGGLALGSGAGNLIGILAMFVSGFFFGIGPWTPWQMWGFGIGGFIAGFLADRGWVPRVDYGRCALVALAAATAAYMIAILGFILDSSTLYMINFGRGLIWDASVYQSGLPVNTVQAIGNFFTILIVANPLLDKLVRASTKLGLMDDRM